MIVCPVCENQQAAGDVCDVCGKRLVAEWGAPDAPVERLAELEATGIVARGAPAVQATPLPDLEVTGVQSGPDLPAVRLAELERTAIEAPASSTPILPLDEMDLGRAEDDGVRTALPAGPIVCRYCRHEQAQGTFCDACGMHLPVIASPPGTAAVASPSDEPVFVICQKCGTRSKVGRACGSCGVMVPMPEA